MNNIFDTQLAAAFLGFQTQLSLKTLLKEILGIEMEKESVEYLIQLKEYLQQQLAKSQYQDFF